MTPLCCFWVHAQLHGPLLISPAWRQLLHAAHCSLTTYTPSVYDLPSPQPLPTDGLCKPPPPRRQQPAAADAHPTPSPHPRSRRRQIDYAAALSGPAPAGSSLPVVGPDDIEAIVASWTGVPVERMSEDESARLAGLVRA